MPVAVSSYLYYIGMDLKMKRVVETNLIRPYFKNSCTCANNKTERFSYIGECGIHVSIILKEELVWAIDKAFSLLVHTKVMPLRNYMKNNAISNVVCIALWYSMTL